MKRANRIFYALIAFTICCGDGELAVKESEKLARWAFFEGSTGENEISDGPCDTTFDYAKNERINEAKEQYMVDNPTGMGGSNESVAVKLKDFPVVMQECTNWCGPSVIQMTLAHMEYLERGRNRLPSCSSKQQYAKEMSKPFKGTCITHTSPTLNNYLSANFFSGYKVGRGTEDAAISLIEKVNFAVDKMNRPVICSH